MPGGERPARFHKICVARGENIFLRKSGPIRARIQSVQFGVNLLEQEKRRAPRYPFVATAEVIAVSSSTGITTRVTELGLRGCHIELKSPFPEGTVLKVKIYADGKFFEAPATVVYTNPDAGMGVMFDRIHPHFARVLQRWILEAATAKREPQA